MSKKTLNPVFDQRYASTQWGRQLCSPLKEGLVVPWNDGGIYTSESMSEKRLPKSGHKLVNINK